MRGVIRQEETFPFERTHLDSVAGRLRTSALQVQFILLIPNKEKTYPFDV